MLHHMYMHTCGAVACFARARCCAMVALVTTMVPRAEVREAAQHLALADRAGTHLFFACIFSLQNLLSLLKTNWQVKGPSAIIKTTPFGLIHVYRLGFGVVGD